MPTAQANGITIEYDTFGSPDDPALLLVMGFTAQMTAWREDFCKLLADRGLFVIRYDNRDCGLSQKFDGAALDMAAMMQAMTSGEPFTDAPYTLSDMAADGIGLLDHLGIERAHVLGASMGGMIVQTMAIEEPTRVRSLTSIMSTTGDPAVGMPAEAAMGVLLAPPATDRESAIQRAVDTYRVIGSPGFELDEQALRERAALSYDRRYNPAGVARQLAAILTTADRTADLGAIDLPTLVIHGEHDSLVNVSGGRATAAAIPGAELLVVDGMGHDLPRAVWPELTDRIAALVERAEKER